MGECKPRRAPVPLPRNEMERRSEVLDQLQSFELPPPSTPQLQLDRTNCPLVFERHAFDTKLEQKQHWRYTAIAFIDILSQCLGLSSDIALTACIYFHRVFDRGIYAKERYKFAAACLFLSAKASSKRMKLLRMVRIMFDILETPLYAGDEELLELERLQLLFYEMEVLQGINFELTSELPFYSLRRVLEKMPDKMRSSIQDEAQTVLEELFFLPLCVEWSPQVLGEAAAYIATWNKGKEFKFQWCSPSSTQGQAFNDRTATFVLRSHRSLQRWKKSQQRDFDALIESSSAVDEGDEMEKLKTVFKTQRSGLRLDPSAIQDEAEFTKKAPDDSKEWIGSDKRRSMDKMASAQTTSRSSSRPKRGNNETEPRIKLAPSRSFRTEDYEETSWRRQREHRELERYRAQSRSRSRSRSGDKYYGRDSWSTGKYDRHARSTERRDRYDDDDDDDDGYSGRDRYRDRKRRENKYESRGRSSDYDRSYSSRDVAYRRESASYHDRRDRKSNGSSSYRERDSRSTSRSTSRSRSPREGSRYYSKRKRSYSTRGHSDSRSRSSSRSYSRDRGQSYWVDDSFASSSSSRKGRAKQLHKYGPARSNYHEKERVRT